LHDEEIWVVDIELHTLKEILHRLLGRTMPADQVLARPVERDLSRSLSKIDHADTGGLLSVA
jgi:hypothetical protein